LRKCNTYEQDSARYLEPGGISENLKIFIEGINFLPWSPFEIIFQKIIPGRATSLIPPCLTLLINQKANSLT
jgi:hypothetical protein